MKGGAFSGKNEVVDCLQENEEIKSVSLDKELKEQVHVLQAQKQEVSEQQQVVLLLTCLFGMGSHEPAFS